MEKLKEVVLEALFPAACVTCKRPSETDASPWLCANCAAGLRPHFQTFCHVCGKQKGLKSTRACPHGPTALESVSTLFLYQDITVRRLIHALKYYFVKDTLVTWNIFLQREKANLLRLPVDLVVPLPLHKRKLRERGFNQAELIAQTVGTILKKPIVANALVKSRSTQAQMKIKNPRTRARNIRGVFRVVDPAATRGKNILLVDDVVTTGSTLEEAARTLKAAGGRKVYAFVLARD